MSRTTTCPDEHELLGVATGESAVDAIAGHLAGCLDCRGRVDRLRAELVALRRDFDDRTHLPSAEPNPAVDPAGAACRGVTSLEWIGGSDGPPAAIRLRPPASPDRDRGEARPERPGAIGRYLVVDQLDEGSQGLVYRVIHPRLGRDMVLKLGRQPVGDDDRASLVAEGRLVADLEHINLVKIYDLDFHNDRPFLVMEYVHGRNLADYVVDEPVTPRRAAILVAKLAGALAMVHRRGIIHRDIKPRNILIDESGEPRLIDFGLARLRHAWSDRAASTWGGTLSFMAPEQARREHDRIGPRSDVFGLGAVLYFLLTGRAPFLGETQDEVWDRARRCDFDAAAPRRARVPRRLERICLKAMAADPSDRYATAEDMGRALQRPSGAPRRIGVAAGLLMAVAVSYAIYRSPAWPRTSEPSSTAGTSLAATQPSATVPGPMHGAIDLWVDEPGNGDRRAIRLHQTGAVPVKAGDEVRVEARVDRPADLYLFWLGSDGKVAPLYPWKEHDWSRRPAREEKVSGVEVPEVIDETMVLPPSPPGLETLVLLARDDSPLPLEAGAALEHTRALEPSTRIPAGMNQAVWIENGQEIGLDDRGKEPNRGLPNPRTRKNDDPVLHIREHLRTRLSGLGSYHRAVIVPSQGGR
jgi:predicted Ser/Thr protein kinase